MKYLIEILIALVFFSFISCVEEKQEEDFAGFTEIASEKNTRKTPRYTADTTTEVDGSIVKKAPPVKKEEEVKTDNKSPFVLPEHKQGFIKWLGVEKDFAIKHNGAGHPVVKFDIFGKIIEKVKNDEPNDGGDIQQQYNNYLDFLQ